MVTFKFWLITEHFCWLSYDMIEASFFESNPWIKFILPTLAISMRFCIKIESFFRVNNLFIRTTGIFRFKFQYLNRMIPVVLINKLLTRQKDSILIQKRMLIARLGKLNLIHRFDSKKDASIMS